MSAAPIDKAVVLARGVGTRMRKSDGGTRLTGEQARAADAGMKALMPIDRPFLDYGLTALADAGYKRVCLVIGPQHDRIRAYYGGQVQPRRLTIEFAVQERPLGTADAVSAARGFAGEGEFLVLNSDDYYPPAPLAALREAGGPALVGFSREGLLGGNVAPDRIAGYALVEADHDGFLARIVEKPDPAVLSALGEDVLVSKNCWRFGPAIFEACGAIQPSRRGELELTDAVQHAIDNLGVRFRMLTSDAAVLDLSSRSDIEAVARRLAGVEINL